MMAKARPIGFSAAMVPLVLNNEKTQTRRSLNPQPGFETNEAWTPRTWFVWRDRRGRQIQAIIGDPDKRESAKRAMGFYGGDSLDACPYGQPGDMLYLSERIEWLWVGCDARGHWVGDLRYRADGLERRVEIPDRVKTPSIGRWPGRTLPIEWARPDRLEIVAERIEHLQDIVTEDAKAEGVLGWRNGWSKKQAAEAFLLSGSGQIPTKELGVPRALFMMLWISIHGKRGYEANPFCWCISFKRRPG